MQLKTESNRSTRDTETILRKTISITKNRKVAREIFDLSESSMSRFMSGHPDESKINVSSISEVIDAMGFTLTNQDHKSYDPSTHTAVPIPILEAMSVFSSIGHSAAVSMLHQGPECLPERVIASVSQLKRH